ncbi:hypothetical protein BLNAU_8306 [Blattamonas nauphoetae]|uniref:Uncharacterized protein n=1 Tax=Blattamonas nauphoetae TaxID=2049346 RepID=A0ABQ9XYV5_9EUKA|nr:hypothetical protein BLNAU_8306 [Blattamonas nauphoetae]
MLPTLIQQTPADHFAFDSPLEDLMEHFTKCVSEFKSGDDTAKTGIVLSVFTIISYDMSAMKDKSSIGIRSGLLETFSECISQGCPFNLLAILSSVIGLMVTCVSEGKQNGRNHLISSLLTLTSHPDPSLSIPATNSVSLLCRGSLSSGEVEDVLNSGVIEILCNRLESSPTKDGVNLISSLRALDSLSFGLREVIEKEEKKEASQKTDCFSRTRRCRWALARIENAIMSISQFVRGKREEDTTTQELQAMIGGFILRHFDSSISSVKRATGPIAIDLVKVRQEMEEEREKGNEEVVRIQAELKAAAQKAEDEREKEFEKKMKQLDDFQKANQHLIKKGQQKEEEERLRGERRALSKRGAATIEVFKRDACRVERGVFTTILVDPSPLLSPSYGEVVVRITFIIRALADTYFYSGLISTDLTDEVQTGEKWFFHLKGGASWLHHPSMLYAKQNNKEAHPGIACLEAAVGQRVVMEADGRKGKRTLKLSQDGVTQPVFFTNIPVPFRFAVQNWKPNGATEMMSTEVLIDSEMVGGTLPVKMDE